MKLYVFFILVLSFPLSLFSQESEIPGEYGKFVETKNGSIVRWTVNLMADGAFLYNFYRKLPCQTCEEENFWGKGNWTANENIITIHSDQEKDMDSTFTMNFSNTKARLKRKPARSLSNKNQPEKLIFYDSPLFEIKGLKLEKNKS